jgi:predicted Zn-dependent protease with MMP-like domain
MSRERFEELAVQEEQGLIAHLPRDLKRDAQEVIIEIADRPTPEALKDFDLEPGETLYGAYLGVPLVERHADNVLLAPSRIWLFQEPLTSAGRTEVEVRRQIRRTLVHEIAHHFGMSEEELERRGQG